MPARINVYCRKSVAHLTPEMFRHELSMADLFTLAECLHLPEGEEAAVKAMRPHLRVEGEAPFVYAEVHCKPEGRPIQISRRVDVEGELIETIENLPLSETPGAQQVKEQLRLTKEIVHFEMGISDSNHLGAVLAEVLAFFIAEQGEGLVWFYHRDWASPTDRGANLWNTSVIT
jgi:hypothetical protein